MKKNLFIIRSPLQLINMLEAIKEFNLKNNLFIIIETKSNANNIQISEVLKLYNTHDIEINTLKSYSNSKLFHYIKLIKSLQKYTYDYIFIGSYGSIQNIICQNLKSNNIFLVDDGTMTLQIQKEIYNKKSFKDNIKTLRYQLFGLKTLKYNKVNFFTFLDLQPLQDEIIIKNCFNYLQEIFSQSNKNDSSSEIIYIIGQPLYNHSNELTEISYMKYLKEIFLNYPEHKIYYIPHRSEKISLQLHTYITTYAKIHINKYPIEIELLLNNIPKPTIVVGFFSTALYTIMKMYQDIHVFSYKIQDKDILDSKRLIEIKNFYNFFELNNIKIKILQS